MKTQALGSGAIAMPGWEPAIRMGNFAIEHYLLLPIGGLLALGWANLAAESYFRFVQPLAFPVNDVGMALFFGLVTQEIVEATLPGGALHTWRRWVLPVVAAAGATAGGAVVYLWFVSLQYELVLTPGWPVAGAIDLAFGYFVVKSIFGRHAAVPFVLLTAIVANGIGVVFVASRHAFIDPRPGGAVLMAAALGLALALRRFKVHTFWPYLVLCGPLSWLALSMDGFHPALALVPIVPFVPHAPRGLDLFGDAAHGVHDSPRHFEHVWHYPVHAVLFLFGLVNAGVLISGYGTGTWALLAAAVVGKPVGLIAALAVASAVGLHLPRGLHWRDLLVVAPATAGGFTFGLFFATAVFPLGPILAELKIGTIATGVGVPLAFFAAWLFGVGRFPTRKRRRR